MNRIAGILLFLVAAVPGVALANGEATTKEDCESTGGTWARFGMLGNEYCDRKTSDAGKPCRSSSDCESKCYTPEHTAPGIEKEGKCFERTITLGQCLNFVENGKTTGTICAD